MKSMRWLGLGAVCVLGAAAAPALVGCGGSKTTGGQGGSTSTTGAGMMTTSSKTSAAVTTSVSGSSSSTGGGNHTFDTATPITLPATMATPGTLADTGTTDYYSFVGKAGDRFLIQATAQGIVMPQAGHDPNDPTVIDTVVVLYKADKTTVWASNDDGWPRIGTDSTLFTQLPEDGTYYFTVQDCNGYAMSHSGVSCAPAANITVFDYQVFVADISKAMDGEQVGSNSAPVTVKYTANPQSMGNSFIDTLDGQLSAAGDKHTFNFTPTSTTTKVDPAARARAYFWVQPIGAVDGTGAATNITVTAKDKNGKVLAVADQQHYTNGDDPNNGPLQFSFPLDDQFGNALGSTYTVEVTPTGGTPFTAMKNYYIVQHFAGSWDYGQAETEGPAKSGLPATFNDSAATAQMLTMPTGVKTAYFVDGNITAGAPADVDWFTMAVPTGLMKNIVAINCSAARDGSGLVGLTATLFKDAASAALNQSVVQIGPEVVPAVKDLSGPAMGTMLPAGATSLLLKVNATGQAPGNDSTYYQCSVFFQ